MTNARLSGTHRTMNVSLTTALWMRARRAVIAHNVTGGVSQLVREGLELRLAQLDARPVDFDTAFRMEHGRWATFAERLASYGAAVVENCVPGHAEFTLTELRRHFEAGVWSRRTAELVLNQRAIWVGRGQPNYQQVLLPPRWDEVVADHERVVRQQDLVEGEVEGDPAADIE
jgi:hypothetical protein